MSHARWVYSVHVNNIRPLMRACFAVSCCILLTISLSLPRAHCQESSRFTFLPGPVAIPPLTASYREPRVGVRKETATSHLKLDIGSTLDVLEYGLDKGRELRLGVDFFTYALTTNAQGLRLQVDAVDGYFGGHITYRAEESGNVFALRLRLLHLSAHFLDGHFNNTTGTWMDGREPIPFTKDFGELLCRYEWRVSSLVFLAYSGISYATLVRPVEIRRVATLHGFEAYTSALTGPVFMKPCNAYIAADLSLTGIPAYVGTTSIEAGVKLGQWSGSGLKLYLSFYSGLSAFSQYYDVRESQWGVGFAFDFW